MTTNAIVDVPLASPGDCLEAECRSCGASPGDPCDPVWITLPNGAKVGRCLAALVLGPGFRGMCLRRYVDYTGDRR